MSLVEKLTGVFRGRVVEGEILDLDSVVLGAYEGEPNRISYKNELNSGLTPLTILTIGTPKQKVIKGYVEGFAEEKDLRIGERYKMRVLHGGKVYRKAEKGEFKTYYHRIEIL